MLKERFCNRILCHGFESGMYKSSQSFSFHNRLFQRSKWLWGFCWRSRHLLQAANRLLPWPGPHRGGGEAGAGGPQPQAEDSHGDRVLLLLQIHVMLSSQVSICSLQFGEKKFVYVKATYFSVRFEVYVCLVLLIKSMTARIKAEADSEPDDRTLENHH